MYVHLYTYGVATISRMLKNIVLFCKRALQKRPIFCKETFIFKHPTNRSHPISCTYKVRINTYIHTHVHLRGVREQCTYMYIFCIYMYIFTYVHLCACQLSITSVYKFVFVYVFVYIYICIHVHIYTQPSPS